MFFFFRGAGGLTLYFLSDYSHPVLRAYIGIINTYWTYIALFHCLYYKNFYTLWLYFLFCISSMAYQFTGVTPCPWQVMTGAGRSSHKPGSRR